MSTTASAIESSCTSADPRKGVADQLVHDPPSAEARLHKHHPGRLGPHFADLRRHLAAFDRTHVGETGDGIRGSSTTIDPSLWKWAGPQGGMLAAIALDDATEVVDADHAAQVLI